MLQQNKAGDAHTKLPVPALPSCCTIPAPRCSCPPVLLPGPKFPFPPASSLSCRPAGDAVSSSRAGGLELVVSWDCLLRREPRESPVSCRTRQECHTGILVVKGPWGHRVQPLTQHCQGHPGSCPQQKCSCGCWTVLASFQGLFCPCAVHGAGPALPGGWQRVWAVAFFLCWPELSVNKLRWHRPQGTPLPTPHAVVSHWSVPISLFLPDAVSDHFSSPSWIPWSRVRLPVSKHETFCC